MFLYNGTYTTSTSIISLIRYFVEPLIYGKWNETAVHNTFLFVGGYKVQGSVKICIIEEYLLKYYFEKIYK